MHPVPCIAECANAIDHVWWQLRQRLPLTLATFPLPLATFPHANETALGKRSAHHSRSDSTAAVLDALLQAGCLSDCAAPAALAHVAAQGSMIIAPANHGVKVNFLPTAMKPPTRRAKQAVKPRVEGRAGVLVRSCRLSGRRCVGGCSARPLARYKTLLSWPDGVTLTANALPLSSGPHACHQLAGARILCLCVNDGGAIRIEILGQSIL